MDVLTLYLYMLVCFGVLFLFALVGFAFSDRNGKLFFLSTVLFFLLLFMVPVVLVLLIVMWRDTAS